MGEVIHFSDYIKERNHEIDERISRLKDGNGSGTSGGMGDDFKDGVTKRLDGLDRDFRMLLYAFVAGFLLLLFGGYKLYEGLSEKVGTQQVMLERVAGEAATRDATIEGKIDVLLERVPSRK